MSAEQRAAANERYRRPAPAGPPSLEEMRAGFAAVMGTMRETGGVTVSEARLGGRRVVRVEPEGSAAAPRTIVYFHGGAYVLGSPETAMSLATALAARTRMSVLSVDYRRAPEHPFPAAVEDAVAAYREVLGRYDPRAIAFAGDSAGGGVAIAACLMARDAGLPMPAAVVAFSGSWDATLSGASMDEKAGIDPIFTRERLAPMIAMYLNGQDPKQALVSPAIAGDLRGLPPLLLQVGTNEVLLDDSTRLARRAWAAGIDVVLDVTTDVPHVFQTFTGVLDEADEALDRAAHFLGQRVHTG